VSYLKFEKISFFRRLEGLSENLKPTVEEFVCILSIALVLTFLLSVGFTKTYIYSELSGGISYGFPFESLGKTYEMRWRWMMFNEKGSRRNVTYVAEEVNINGEGLSLNLMTSGLISFVFVKTISRIKEEIYYYRYDKK
jgi:hypothetical protein